MRSTRATEEKNIGLRFSLQGALQEFCWGGFFESTVGNVIGSYYISRDVNRDLFLMVESANWSLQG